MDFGKIPPKISLPNQQGELINIQELKEDFVLLEFWASWCAPCRQTNPELLKIYNFFKNDSFEIFGVSMDNDVDKWKKAIKEDSLGWIQVIDTTGRTKQTYNLSSIPYNLLLNKEGKIIARNIKLKNLKEILKAHVEFKRE